VQAGVAPGIAVLKVVVFYDEKQEVIAVFKNKNLDIFLKRSANRKIIERVLNRINQLPEDFLINYKVLDEIRLFILEIKFE
jgi:hypothetical protein